MGVGARLAAVSCWPRGETSAAEQAQMTVPSPEHLSILAALILLEESAIVAEDALW